MSGRSQVGRAGRLGRAFRAGLGQATGLLVGDGAVALGVLVAVTAAGVLTVLVGPTELVGWVLLGLVWVALGASLARVRRRRER